MKKHVVAVAASALILSGCATDGSDQGKTFGTVLGGVAGAVIGAQFGKGTGQLVATALGTLAGAYLGSQIGAMLDERQKEELDARTGQALATAKDGEVITWNDPDSDVKAEITTANSRVETRQVQVARPRDVAPLPPIDLIGETYAARTTANVRAAPTTDAAVTTQLKAGEPFTAVGRVQGQDWIVAARGNRTVGYVHAPLVGPAETAVAAAAKAAEPQRPAVREAKDLDALMAEDGVDLDAEGLVAETVQVSAQCRTAEIRVTKGDKTETATQDVCRAPDGAWEVI